jgi:hypothetical protein
MDKVIIRPQGSRLKAQGSRFKAQGSNMDFISAYQPEKLNKGEK